MRDDSVARRYARAYFNQALAGKTLDTASKDLKSVAQTMRDVPALRDFLNHPLGTETRKKAILEQTFGKEIAPASLHFLNLLVDKRRMTNFVAVQEEFETRVRAHKNVAAATAISAVPLSKEQVVALEKSLEAKTGQDIELTVSVDPSLLGGLLVRIGDTVYDGTVKGKLDRLREALLTRR
jgi:F-type H+-transporting ATPase subunit delta